MSRSANRLNVMSIELENMLAINAWKKRNVHKPETSLAPQGEIKMPTLEERFERILKDRTYYRSLDEDEAEPKESDEPEPEIVDLEESEPEPEEEETEGEIIFEGDYLRGRRRWKETILDMIAKGEERRTIGKDHFLIRDLSNGRMKITINSEDGWCGMHAHIGGSKPNTNLLNFNREELCTE
jgi:hypothetical protein